MVPPAPSRRPPVVDPDHVSRTTPKVRRAAGGAVGPHCDPPALDGRGGPLAARADGSLGARPLPLGAVLEALALPDRQPTLELLDDVAARLVGRRAMRGSRHD